MKKIRQSIIFVMAAVFLSSFSCLGAEVNTPSVTPSLKNNSTAKMAEDMTVPISIVYSNKDATGTKLLLKLQNALNTSPMFTLTPKETPKLQIMLTATPEFSSRPSVGSAYSVTWVYYEGINTFMCYLDQEVGIVSEENVTDVALTLVAKTNELARKYFYLFK